MRGLITLLVIVAVIAGVWKAGEANRTMALVLAALVLLGLFVWRAHD